VAKSIFDRFSGECTAWFDYGESGNKQICVVYTKAAPLNQKASAPPWEPGSTPPPFMLEIQKNAQELAAQGQGSQGARLA
jgi:hypothetical protein